MKRWTLFWMVGLLACCLLAGCGKEKKKETPADKADEVLMAVGEEAVSCQEAMAYLYLLKRQYESGMGEGIWSFEVEPGKTFEDYAKEEVVSNLTQLKIICQEAAVEEVSLEEEEVYEARQAAKQLLKSAKEEDVGRFELAEDTLARVYEDNALATKFFDVATAEVDTNISDEEARQVTIQYLLVSTDKMSKKQKKAAKQQAEKLRSQAKKASSFLSFASSNSDLEEVELSFGKEDMPEFGEAAMELKTGELSSLVEGEKGYYILHCVTDFDEDATRAKKEAMIEEKRDALFRERYKEWSGKYKTVVSASLWDEVSFTTENAALEQN